MNQFKIRKHFQIATLVVVFIFALKFFQSTPFETLFFQLQAGFLGLILMFLVGYVAKISISQRHVNRVVLYFLVLIAIIPFYGAFRASSEFRQPFI